MPSHIHMRKTNDWIVDLGYLSLVFIVFYFIWLGSYPLFIPDEGRYSEVAREMVATGDYITPRVNGVVFLDKPILYYWFQALAINLFGIKEWALRLFPALFGISGCLIVYICGRKLFNRRTGLISAIILATTPLYFGSAHYANLDLEVAVLVSGTLLFFITATKTHGSTQRYFYIAMYFFAALAFLTKGLIAIAFPCLIGGTWMMCMRDWNILKKMQLLMGIFLFLVITLPWYILVQHANPEFLHYFFITQQVTRFLSAAAFNNPTPFWFYLPVVFIGFFPWSMFLPQTFINSYQRIRHNRSQHGTELYLLLWFVIVFVFFSIPRSKTLGYILPVYPPLALLVGYYIETAWNNAQQEKTSWTIAMYASCSILLAGLFLLVPYKNWFALSAHFTPYLITISILSILSAAISLSLIFKDRLLPFFSLCVITSSLCLAVIAVGSTYLNQNSAKPLVTELKTIIKPQDEVINYFKFYHDVPLYLEQRITLVANWQDPDIAQKDNWVRELWYGMPFQETNSWLINEPVFWERFNSDHRVFVFLNDNYFDQFKAVAQHYFVLGKQNDIILLSNKPTMLSKNP